MTIKIVHTADNHIGMRYSHIPNAEAKGKLVAERLECLKYIVDFANKKEAHFLVVAGDLFDRLTVSAKEIKETGSALNKFNGEAVLVLPGNHDFYTDEQGALWKKVAQYVNEQKVLILSDDVPQPFSVGETEVMFFPAACRAQHSKENAIGWVKPFPKKASVINIGIAHGNVEGYALDDDQRYFNMTTDELKKSGVDFWLLGHIHVPHPKQSVNSNPGFFYSATHTPDGFGKTHAGHFWFIEVDEKKNIKAELRDSDSIRQLEHEKKINSIGDFELLKSELDTFTKEKTALRLTLTGRLSKEEIEQVQTYLDSIKDKFLFFEQRGGIKMKIDRKFIDSRYANDSLPHKLMSELLDAKDEGLSLQMANEIIENLNADK